MRLEALLKDLTDYWMLDPGDVQCSHHPGHVIISCQQKAEQPELAFGWFNLFSKGLSGLFGLDAHFGGVPGLHLFEFKADCVGRDWQLHKSRQLKRSFLDVLFDK